VGGVFTAVGLLYPAGALLLAVWQWRKMFRLYGDWSGRGLAAMLHASLAVRRKVLFVGMTLTLIAFTAAMSIAFKLSGGAIAILGIAAISFFTLTQVVLPPGVLFLGSSSSRNAVALAERLGRVLAGYRPVYFLAPDISRLQPRNLVLFMSNSYYGRSSDWRDRVRRLAEAVPLIVCDGRNATGAVREEIEFLFRQHRLAAKTYFVNDVPRELPFALMNPDAGRGYLWVSEDDVITLLPEVLAYGGPRRLPPRLT
jgi:hypothetical protein